MATSTPQPTLASLLDSHDSRCAQKALDFFDGKQNEWMVALLSDPEKGRKNWKQRGMIPRTRNVTKAIVEKSGLLFSQYPPRVFVYADTAEEPDVPSSELLIDLLEEFDWVEFFQNFDAVVRLMKTALVLIQWDPEGERIVPSILTQANAYVQCNSLTGEMQLLVVKLAGSSEAYVDPETGTVADLGEVSYFRLFTKTMITDFEVDAKGMQRLVSQLPNPFGIIPAAVFHDTAVPRADTFWNQGPHDLVHLQEMVNLHITESEYSASYAKLQTLVTNARVVQGDPGTPQTSELYGSSLPRMNSPEPAVIAGPGSIITLESNGTTPFVEFMGPNPDLDKLDQMVSMWITQYAQDWSVNVKAGRTDSAQKTSGFQLVVEEFDNLQLRLRRQKMMAAGFNRLFSVITTIVNTVRPGTFAEGLELFIEFSQPRLPLDPQDEEKTWDIRIAANRASRIDYFMETQGLSRQEAIAKITEIDAVNTGTLDYHPTEVSSVAKFSDEEAEDRGRPPDALLVGAQPDEPETGEPS